MTQISLFNYGTKSLICRTEKKTLKIFAKFYIRILLVFRLIIYDVKIEVNKNKCLADSIACTDCYFFTFREKIKFEVLTIYSNTLHNELNKTQIFHPLNNTKKRLKTI